jgi:glycine hydroxymethyltransferase
MIVLASDHGGFEAKELLRAHLEGRALEVMDLGTTGSDSVDYPDFALELAHKVAKGEADTGILVCGTGIGMSIAANKVPGIRAALVTDTFTARMAKEHNNANVIVLGGRTANAGAAEDIVDSWLDATFEGGRHALRLEKIHNIESVFGPGKSLKEADSLVWEAIQHETVREEDSIVLIASENYASEAVMEAQGSVFTNKYAEGYPGKRYYGGCEFADVVENLAIERAKELFGAEYANVQPLSGSAANMAAYHALLEPGDKIVSMALAHGGHLTHGASVSFSGKLYDIVNYGVEKDTGMIDYDKLAELVKREKPRALVAGASSYSRTLDFPRFREIADSVGALFIMDMAHIAGLVAGGSHPNPVPYADIVTTTTHKTLRGPRGGMVLCRKEYGAAIDKAVFPGLQGGPLVHSIAGKAVAFLEAMNPAFKTYADVVVENAKRLAQVFIDAGYNVVSGGTDNHLFVIDFTGTELTGAAAEASLDRAAISLNKNSVPYDTQKPTITSGVRVGTPIVTTRGMGPEQMDEIGALMIRVLENCGDAAVESQVRVAIADLCRKFPFHPHIVR